MRDVREVPAADRHRSTELVVLIVLAGSVVIVFGGWLVVAGRVKALEKEASTDRSLAGRLSTLSSDIDALSSRVKGLEGKLAGLARVEAELSSLSGRIDLLKRSQEPAGQTTLLNELVATVKTLNSDLDRVRKLAEEAARKAAPEPPPQGSSGPGAQELAALSNRLDSLEARLTELAKKPPPAAPPARINEEALRSTIRQMVEDEFKRLRDELLEQLPIRRRPVRGG